MHQIAPDTTRRPGLLPAEPTHYHCYRWSGHGLELDRVSRTDTLDLHSPDRPPIRTVEWLGKSPRFIAVAPATPEQACEWLIAEWESACERAMTPVPEWVSTEGRAVRALESIRSGYWPSWSQWVAGGTIVFMAVVGTDQSCH
jgi:hypothetical protein